MSEHLEPDEEMLTAVDDQMLPEMAEAYHALMEDCVALPLALEFARELVKLSAGREWFQCRVKANKGRGGDVELWVEQAARPLVGVMSGNSILTQAGVIGVFATSQGVSHGDTGHREGGPHRYLPVARPA